MPAATASSTIYCSVGLSTMGSISLQTDFVTGKKRVPKPAAGMTALRTFFVCILFFSFDIIFNKRARFMPIWHDRTVHRCGA